jgi:hypothetical protein
MNTVNRNIYFFVSLLVMLSGCAVGMAASGQKDLDVSVLEVGQSRKVVESFLGVPVSTLDQSSEKRTDVYEYEIGDQPSTGRAWMHGALDVVTIGLWEFVGSAIEGSKGDMYSIPITYGPDDRLLAVGQSTLKTKVATPDTKDEEIVNKCLNCS